MILSIETSAAACSVALHNQGRLVDMIQISEPQAHAAKLAVLIDQLLRINKVTKQQLLAVAISSGPGSYTGLRIGTSMAKGVCLGLNIPLINVPTLRSMAHHVFQESKGAYLCPMVDARRMEVYCQVFDNDLEPVNAAEPVIVDTDSFRELLHQQKVLFFGDGAAKCKSVIIHENAEFVDGVYPKASLVGEVAWEEFQKSSFADLIEFTPFYLKEFVAKKAKTAFDQKN